MKRIFAAICVILTISSMTSFSQAQESRYMDSYVEVNGNAEKEVSPDLFYLRVDIDEQDSKGHQSLDKQQNDMLNALRRLGIDVEKQVIRLSLSSSYYNRKSNMASASYQIKATSAAQLSQIWSRLDELVLSGVKFQKAECSNIDEIKQEVLRLAVQNARVQAASMAEAIGQTVGKCFYIYENYSDASTVYARPMMLSKSMMADGANMLAESASEDPLEFDKIKVTARVSARFVLQ